MHLLNAINVKVYQMWFFILFSVDEETEYQTIDFYEETRVKFADLSETMLWDYIDSGEPM